MITPEQLRELLAPVADDVPVDFIEAVSSKAEELYRTHIDYEAHGEAGIWIWLADLVASCGFADTEWDLHFTGEDYEDYALDAEAVEQDLLEAAAIAVNVPAELNEMGEQFRKVLLADPTLTPKVRPEQGAAGALVDSVVLLSDQMITDLQSGISLRVGVVPEQRLQAQALWHIVPLIVLLARLFRVVH